MAPDPASANGARRALVVLLAVVFVNMAGFGIVIPLLPFYGRAFHAGALGVGVLFATFSLGQLFAEAFWGRLSDRIGRRPVLLATIAGSTLCYVGLAFAPSLWVACLFRFLGGLMSGNVSTIQGYLADVTPPERRAARLGHLGAAFSAGFVAGPALGGLLARPAAGVEGFRLPLLTAAAFAGLAAVCAALFARETRHPAHRAAPARSRLEVAREAAADPVTGRVLLAGFIVVSAFAGIESTYGLWTQARFGWGPHELGLAFMGIGIAGSLSQGLATGALARRFGSARVLAWGLALVGLGMIVQMTAPTWPVAIGGLFVVVFGQSLTFPSIGALISISTAPERQGEVLGLNMSANGLARIGGPLWATAAFAHVGVAAPFAASALLLVPGWALARQVRARTRGRA